MKFFTSHNSLLALAVAVLTLCGALTSCEEEQTYAEQKKAERRAINTFLNKGCTVKDKELGDVILHVDPVKVISEDQFKAQDSTTNVALNEYVLLNGTGIYMQIVRKGTGKKLSNGENARVICRYIEYNIQGDSVQTLNNNAYYIAVPDMMNCLYSQGTLTGTYTSGMMLKSYGDKNVPEGWLTPLHYINLGRQNADTDEIAKVRLIVPHSSGQSSAVKSVYPCFYEITYEKGR